eukprot:COSAG02_NODE_1373_length_13014_cov_5.725358_4_plen_184_part_00
MGFAHSISGSGCSTLPPGSTSGSTLFTAVGGQSYDLAAHSTLLRSSKSSGNAEALHRCWSNRKSTLSRINHSCARNWRSRATCLAGPGQTESRRCTSSTTRERTAWHFRTATTLSAVAQVTSRYVSTHTARCLTAARQDHSGWLDRNATTVAWAKILMRSLQVFGITAGLHTKEAPLHTKHTY